MCCNIDGAPFKWRDLSYLLQELIYAIILFLKQLGKGIDT